MIIEVTMYTIQCDNCLTNRGENQEYSCWNDDGYAEEEAIESDWHKEGDAHYCPECFSFDEDGEIVIDKTRTKTESHD